MRLLRRIVLVNATIFGHEPTSPIVAPFLFRNIDHKLQLNWDADFYAFMENSMW